MPLNDRDAPHTMTPSKHLTAKALAFLKAFLARSSHPEGTLSFGELRGFLFALNTAPDLVKPSEWLPFIFGDQEPDFESMNEAQRVMDHLMSLYNDINREVRAKGPRLPKGVEFREEILSNLEPDASVSAWSRGFMSGHMWLKESWEAYLPDEMDIQMGSLLGILTFFSSSSVANAIFEEATKPDKKLESFAETFRKLFPEALAEYAGIGMAIWDVIQKERASPFEGTVTEVRSGRNEPCPCGSGKKYKRCCGASDN